jgi:hypothetical protein
MTLPQHDSLTHKHLLCSLALGHAREYFRVVCSLAPFSPTPTFFDTTSTLTALHPKLNGYFPLLFEDYELDQDPKLSFGYFKLVFQHMPHLSTSGPFGMVFEHLRDYFHFEDSTSGLF